MNLRILLIMPVSDCDRIVEETAEGVNEGSRVRRYATKPATCGAAMEVPEMEFVLPSFQVEMMSDPKEMAQMVSRATVPILYTPGAHMSRAAP